MSPSVGNNPCQGRTWLVTGAGSGVGRALAVFLAASGAEVLLAGRTRSRLEDTQSWCGPSSRVIEADLADFSSVDSLSGEVRRHLGGRPLAGIVHAAGVMLWDSPQTDSGWSLVPLVNAVSPWRLTLALEPELLQNPAGRVLFVAGAPVTLTGVGPDVDRWKGLQRGRGLGLALESASAKVFMARVLHRRWGGRALAWAFHPGFVKSRLADGLPFPLSFVGCVAQPFLAARCRTGEFLVGDGAAETLSGSLVAGRRALGTCPFPPDPDREAAFVARLPS